MGTALYDLSPAGTLLSLGGALACLPALWVWLRHRAATAQRRRLALTVLVLFLTFDLILVGAFTRLTDSGLGCPDWPGCYGQSNPLAAHQEISAAQAAMPTGPVTHQKAWIEMVHRYLASSVGALILLMTVLAWRDHAQARKAPPPAGAAGNTSAGATLGPWWPTFTLVWVCVQGAFGALTVTMKLFPAIVSLHLLGAYALLAMLVVQAVRWTRIAELAEAKSLTPDTGVAVPVVSKNAVLAVRWMLALLLLQATSGAWVSTNYAVLVCGEFPLCQGSWWPDMDFTAALEIWRPLGEHADGSIVSFQALTAIHVMHRLLALLAVVAALVLLVRLKHEPLLLRPARAFALLLSLQVVTGLSNVVLDWPLLAAMLHSAGAGALVAVLVWMLALAAQRGSQA